MLLPCMFAKNNLYLESCDLVKENIQMTYTQICPAKRLSCMLNPSASSSITRVFGSRRALVPILEAFTLDVRVSSLSLALCLPNYLLHAGEGHLQCCVGRCSGSATPPAPLLPSVISLPIVNKRIRKVKHN